MEYTVATTLSISTLQVGGVKIAVIALLLMIPLPFAIALTVGFLLCSTTLLTGCSIFDDMVV